MNTIRLITIIATLFCSHLALAQSPSKAFGEFRATLSENERTRALAPFDATDRKAYRLTPGERGGLPIMDMDAETEATAFDLLGSFLSSRGMEVVRGAIDREARLAEIENAPDYRNPDKFYLAIFGEPSAKRWAIRFEGHHFSLNVTLVGDAPIAITPLLIGANPKTLPTGTNDPLLSFLDAHDKAATFLSEIAQMFRAPESTSLLSDSAVKTSGFGLWGHPHMEVSGPRDFGEHQ